MNEWGKHVPSRRIHSLKTEMKEDVTVKIVGGYVQKGQKQLGKRQKMR